ncbi:MAG TPA: hypothetical protein VK550_04185 [Polyangiaceae bacterium]|nr:hypothetical protein [Polyangiaceae bacterium]
MDAAPRWRSTGKNDLAADPELSALVLLDAALAVTLEALPAFVPELDPKACTWPETSPVVLAAREIVVHGRHLRHLIDDYRHKIDPAFTHDDILF